MKYPGQVGSMVPSTASIDKFTAPDSNANRPNPETLNDRSRTPQALVPTSTEAELKGDD